MTANSGIQKPLNSEQVLATDTLFHSGLFSFNTLQNETSGTLSISSSGSCTMTNNYLRRRYDFYWPKFFYTY